MTKSALADATALLLPAIKEVLAHPSVPVNAAQENAVAVAVTKEVAPILVNASNQEPWYQSRVTIGALLALVGAAYTLLLDFYTPPPPSVEVLTAQLGIIGGSVTTLYGRWVAKKPIGQ